MKKMSALWSICYSHR